MIPCIFACTNSVETQTAVVELSNPDAALFIDGSDEYARAALVAWLAQGEVNGRSVATKTPDLPHPAYALPSRTA